MSGLICDILSGIGINPGFCKNKSEEQAIVKNKSQQEDPKARSFLEQLLFGVETEGAVGCEKKKHPLQEYVEIKQFEWEQSIADYQKGISHLKQGANETAVHDFLSAIPKLEAYVKINPSIPQGHFALGHCYMLLIKAAGELPAGDLRRNVMGQAIRNNYPEKIKSELTEVLILTDADNPLHKSARELLSIIHQNNSIK